METIAMIPMETFLVVLAWIAIGLLIGILSAMLGIGGGTIMVPLFRLVGGFSAVSATATSLFVIVPTGISGVYNHLKAGTCNVRVGLAAGIAGACTSVFGAKLADIAPGWIVMVAAACVIAFSAITMLRKALKPAKKPQVTGENANAAAGATANAAGEGAASGAAAAAPERPSSTPDLTSPRTLIFAAVIGLVAGALSGFVGVGGGFLMVPLFSTVLGMDMRHAAGTSLLTVFCVALPAAIAQCIMGNVMVVAGIAVALGSIAGTFAGQRIAMKMSDRALRLTFGALLLVAAILLVVKEFGLL